MTRAARRSLPDRLASTIDPGYDPARAALAGALGAAAYLAEQALDLRLFACPTNDLRLLGRPFSADPRVWPLLGAAIHTFNGVALAQVYGLVGRNLPGPPWLRGATFALIENAAFWAIVPLLDRYHPAIRAGELPRMNRPIPFAQQALRHIAYGAALGTAYRSDERRATSDGRRATSDE